MPGIDESKSFVPLRIAVLTVSDTREFADDKSGQTLVERIEKAGHVLAVPVKERAAELLKDLVHAAPLRGMRDARPPNSGVRATRARRSRRSRSRDR